MLNFGKEICDLVDSDRRAVIKISQRRATFVWQVADLGRFEDSAFPSVGISLAGGGYPNLQAAQTAALVFLQQVAPDLIPELSVVTKTVADSHQTSLRQYIPPARSNNRTYHRPKPFITTARQFGHDLTGR
jgi:hypothetical protein